MQSELKSLSKIFSEVIFRIPDYQRGYSWEEKQLKDFWGDIEQLPDGKNHYTGVLTLEPVTKSNYDRWEDDIWIIEAKHYSAMYVVDGQQRLTTAIVLLQAILDQVKNGDLLNFTAKEEIQKKYIFERKGGGISLSYIFGYEKDNPSYEFLKKHIFGENSINHAVAEDTVYTKNLAAAKCFFSEKLKELSSSQVERVFTALTQRLLFNIFYIEKDLDVFVTFETMNNRGKLLSHLELLKNRLIYLSTKFNTEQSEREHLRKAINESWKSIYHFLGKIKDKAVDDDHFLKTHYIFYFGPGLMAKKKFDHSLGFSLPRHIRVQHQYKDRLLEEVFTPKRLNPNSDEQEVLTIDDVFRYSQNIKSFVSSYYHMFDPESASWPIPHVDLIAKIMRINDYSLFLLTIAAVTNIKGEQLTLLLRAIERTGFIGKLKPYYSVVNDLLEKALELATDKTTAESLVKALNEGCDKFVKSSEFADAARNVGKQSRPGFYGWPQIRYFMYEYELDLKRKSKTSRQLLTWSTDASAEGFDTDHKTIEHIFPQKATDPYWRSAFIKYSLKERNTLRHSLGNLLPVSHAKNASLSNKGFDIKKGSEKSQVGYRFGCLSEIQVSLCDEWNALEILRRGIHLLEFMEKRWALKIGDIDHKAKILGLSFVLEREAVSGAALMSSPPATPLPPVELVELREDKVEL